MNTVEQLEQLVKALEVGSYNASPDSLNQGASLMVEDLSPVMQNVTFDDSHIKLQKMIEVKDSKSQLIQFNRQLDYGIFGGSAQYEGGIGEEDTSNYVRAVVPMAYYSTTRRVSVAANMIGAFDGVKAEDRAASDAAMKLSGDVEFDLFRGQSEFSEAGFFSGNPLAIAEVPNMVGIAPQVRMSDTQSNTQDLMFAEYGSDQTVVLSADGALTQSIIEDAAVRSAMNHGSADKLCLDPISLSAYNKIAHAKERIVLAGSATSKTGAELRQQWTSSALVSLEPSRFLSGKTKPARARSGSLPAPAVANAAATSGGDSVLAAGDYKYFATAVSERGESLPSAEVAAYTIATGEEANLTITNNGAKYYNVYRSAAGGTYQSAKFIGKVKSSGGASTAFVDLGFRSPGSVTGFLVQSNTWGIHQLSAYSRLKMAIHDLSLPEAHFRFLCLAGYQPRKNVLIDNITGQLS
mgnify:CR=1 FL=1